MATPAFEARCERGPKLGKRPPWRSRIAAALLATASACLPSSTYVAPGEPEPGLSIERVMRRAQAESRFVRVASGDSTYERHNSAKCGRPHRPAEQPPN